jgi:signal transduction histidine kinase
MLATLEALFSLSSDAILLLSDGCVARANGAALRLLGIGEEACVGMHRDSLLRLSELATPPGETPVYSLEAVGTTHEVELTTQVIESDGVTYSILTLRDVTHRRDLERAKTNFISMVSHELRTPLNSVLGFSDILLTGAPGGLNDVQREFLGHIKASSERLVQLVNDILDLSRMDAGHFRLSLGPMTPGLPVRQVVAALSGLARDAGVELTVEVAPGLPTVRADGRRVEQVLINLVGNALRFTPSGGSVSLRVVLDETDSKAVVYTVSDTGPGIPPEEHGKIWERFYQPAQPPRLATKGSGLGLTIAKHLVEAHGGRIWLSSEVGRGSTFGFSIPGPGQL